MTGDGPLGYYLHRVTGGKWFSGDIEQEAGCGIVPITYKEKSLVHSLQWAIGLEWYLLIDNPWKIAMSTDHPNGASFLAYPQIIALLMDRSRREDRTMTCRCARARKNRSVPTEARIHTGRDCDHHPCGAGPDSGTETQRPPGSGAPMPISRSTRRIPTSNRCSKCHDSYSRRGRS